MTNAVAQLIQELEQLPEAEQNDLAQWLKEEIASRHARFRTPAGSPRVEEIKQHEYGVPVAVSPRLLSANGGVRGAAGRDDFGYRATVAGIAPGGRGA